MSWGSSRMRTAKRCAPPSITEPTPGSVWIRSLTSWSATSLTSVSATSGFRSVSQMMGRASGSVFWTSGSSTSSGSSPRARLTTVRTSWRAKSTLRESSNSAVTTLVCSPLTDVRVLIPSIVLICSSRTSVTSVSTTSGAAPGRTVVTLTMGYSMSGSSRTARSL